MKELGLCCTLWLCVSIRPPRIKINASKLVVIDGRLTMGDDDTQLKGTCFQQLLWLHTLEPGCCSQELDKFNPCKAIKAAILFTLTWV